MSIPFVLKLIKSQTQPDGGEGYSGMATGYPATVLGKEAALLRQGTASARGDEQEPSQAGLVGRACNTRQSPLSIIGQKVYSALVCVKIRAHPRRSAELSINGLTEPQGEAITPQKSAEGHSSRRKRAGPPRCGCSTLGGFTPTKARTMPGRISWVNGRGCLRACFYRHIVAVAEMPEASCLKIFIYY